MEIWRQIIKLVTDWNGTKRVPGTTQFEDESLFCKALDEKNDRVIRIKEHMKKYDTKDN